MSLCVLCRADPCRCLRALRPLDLVCAPAERGKNITIGPDDIGKERLLFAFDPCPFARGETLAIVLGLKEEGHPCNNEELAGAGLVVPYVQARITWGLGGACRFEAIVDVLRGTVIAVVAETVDVCILYKRFVASSSPVKGCCPTFTVMGGVGYSGRRSDCCARFTHPLFLPQGTRRLIEIPAFASRVTVLPANDASAIKWSLIGDCNGHATTEILTIPVVDHAPSGSPIWNGARQVLVENTGATDATVFVVFTLDLS